MSKIFMKTTKDVMCMICYFKFDLFSYGLQTASYWIIKIQSALRRGMNMLSNIMICLFEVRFYLKWKKSCTDHFESIVDGLCNVEHEVECEVLYDPGVESTLIDVVFIHGLKGDKFKTWKQGLWKQAVHIPQPVVVRSSESVSFNSKMIDKMSTTNKFTDFTNCWPRDWLPLDCPYVRVITVSYSTDPYLWRPIWLKKSIRSSMKDRGYQMISLLRNFQLGHNPIMWVGHSKGGLFIKQILVLANNEDISHKILLNTKGILFYSVPHNGSPLANIKVPLFQRSIELEELVNDNQHIQRLQKDFYQIIKNIDQIKVKSFIETKLTLMKLIYLRIVSIQSADPGLGDLYGVPLDHRNICKPKDRHCFLYQELVNMIDTLKDHLKNQQ
ncbi:protein SERAC1 isoform X2 [Daktulosphaira vitifoliae]|uniref:protein SERAC1 isoform X2 n=1 Tax=Daktulosphaira vitifoliae TaxID=58002 RepID=UPI0021AA5BD9|nr:protein SERAC1 isoform X2 [Daktulosphaira vitifoliae]